MLVVNLLGGDVATIGSQFHYQLADGTQGNGIPQLLPQLVLPWDMPGSNFTLSWTSLHALLPAAFSMAMLGAIESLLCAVVLDGMTGTKHKANSELIGQGLGNIVAPFFGGITATAAIARSAANVRAGATSPVAAVIHALLVILALLILAPLLSWLPLSAMAALLLMVAWNMSEAHKVINLLRHAPKDDIVVMLMCMSLTVLFDMVIAISVGIVLASLLFMRRIARMTHLAPVNVEVPDGVLVLRVIGPLFFAAAEGLFNDLETRIAGKRIVVLKWDAVPVLDAGGLDAFQRFVNKLPEGCELRVSNLEFQPLRTLARAGVKPLPGRPSFYPDRQAALADLVITRRQAPAPAASRLGRLLQPAQHRRRHPGALHQMRLLLHCPTKLLQRLRPGTGVGLETVQATPGPAPDPTPSPALRPPGTPDAASPPAQATPVAGRNSVGG